MLPSIIRLTGIITNYEGASKNKLLLNQEALDLESSLALMNDSPT